jgi:FtsH-binding integral membrane protein
MTQKIRLWFDEPLPHSEHHDVGGESSGQRTLAQRFAIPHDFPPNLTLPEALIRVAGALARILLGSTLFAFWALFSIRAWNAIASPFWHAAVILPLALLFLLPLTGLMLGISAVVRTISPKRH